MAPYSLVPVASRPVTTLYKKIMVKASEFGSRDFATASHIVEVTLPPTPPGHLCVKVGSTGCQASDVIQMAGGYGALKGNTPATEADGSHQIGDLGCEGVGTIVELGEGIDPAEFSVGQAILWGGMGVSFREYFHLPIDGSIEFWKVPDIRPEWTAFPVSAMTAVGGLVLSMAGNIASGQTVMVTGAAGGTGHIAVQWAKRCGCRVAGTCSSEEKATLLKSLGCDVVVNYREQNVEEVLRQEFPEGFDIVYDGVGGKVGNEAKRLLAPKGIFVGIGSASSGYGDGSVAEEFVKAEPMPEQTFTFFFMPNGKKDPEWPRMVAETIEAVSSGEVKIIMDEECGTYPIGVEGVYPAQARIRSGKNVGKIYARISTEE